MDRRAWRATVHGVAKSQTRLSMRTHAHTHRSAVLPLKSKAGMVLAACDGGAGRISLGRKVLGGGQHPPGASLRTTPSQALGTC